MWHTFPKKMRLFNSAWSQLNMGSEQRRDTTYRVKQKQETACDEKLQMQSKFQKLEEHINAFEANVKELSDALDIARSEQDKLAECLTEIELPNSENKGASST